MEIIKAFNANNLHANIVIKGTFDKPLFRASDIGEVLEMGNIRTSIQSYDNTDRTEIATVDILGRTQQTTFLTSKGLYKVLMRSRKPIALIFQNWAAEIIEEIRLTGEYKLRKELDESKQELDQAHQEIQKHAAELPLISARENHNVLLSKFNTGDPLVYVMKVKSFEDGTYIIKIGESRIGIENRYNEHKKKYEEALLLDCFWVKKSNDFERFLHHHEKIRPEKVTNLAGHEKENELFLIGKNLSYNQLIKIVNSNIKQYNENFNMMQVEIDRLTEENTRLKSGNIPDATNIALQQANEEKRILILNQCSLNNTIDILQKENQELKDKLAKASTPLPKITTGFGVENKTIGPRLQKLNPETLQIIKVYETINEALIESNQSLKRPTIQKAVDNNTVYQGHRWSLIARDQDPQSTTHVQPTKVTKTQALGYVAKLNGDKTAILNVYFNRKTAARLNGYESHAALDWPVKTGNISNGYYYMLYDGCSDDLRAAFEEEQQQQLNGRELILYENGVGQFNATNPDEMTNEYLHRYDCQKKCPDIGEKTLAKAIASGLAYNGFIYRMIGSKLSCL